MNEVVERVDALETDVAALKKAVGTRTCPVCGRAVSGRVDKKYCGSGCKSKAYRRRHIAGGEDV